MAVSNTAMSSWLKRVRVTQGIKRIMGILNGIEENEQKARVVEGDVSAVKDFEGMETDKAANTTPNAIS